MATSLQPVIFSLFFALSSSSSAQLQSGGIECAATAGAVRVHFTAYQAPTGLEGGSYLERYCEQIPLPGEIFMTLDIYKTQGGEIIRDKPIAVWVLEGSPGAEANRTLLKLPAKVYSSGIVELHPKLPALGDYHLVVAVGENPTEESTVTIPVRVGESGFLSGDSTTRFMLLLMLVVLGILAGYSFYSGRRSRSKDKKG